MPRHTGDGQGRPEVVTGQGPTGSQHHRTPGLRGTGLRGTVLRGTVRGGVVTGAVALLLAGPGVLTAAARTTGPRHSPLVAGALAAPEPPIPPTPPTPGTNLTIDIGGAPGSSVALLLLLTVLAIAPSLLLLLTSFTKIFVVLSLSRNALGLQTVPPNQVIAGLALFLSMFVMAPVLSRVYDSGIGPFLDGSKDRATAWSDGIEPLREFMLAHTRPQEIALMLRAGNLPNPASQEALDLTTIIPAFVLSEIRAALIIGFVVFLPFVIIDLVVASTLMSLGMMMLPPISVALPFKLLLFVMVDGWGLVVTTLVASYST